jgi:hypothetical protein
MKVPAQQEESLMPKLRSLAFPAAHTELRSVIPPPKQKDSVYNTPEFAQWRAQVLARACYQCEAIDHGYRCDKARPEHRLVADHIVELRDGGSLLDLNNGQCLCDQHHQIKTMAARARRLQWPVPSSGC